MLIRKNFLTIGIVVCGIGAISFYIYTDLNKIVPGGASVVSQEENSKKLGVSIETQNQGDYKVTIDDTVQENTTRKLPPQPSEHVFVAKNMKNVEGPVFEIMLKNVADIRSALQKDPKDEEKWLQLSIYQKNLGDYKKAVEILNYVATVWSNDYVPFNNLADLYQFYIKNYPLAEKNWLKVVELKPDYIQAYQNLYDLYYGLYEGRKDKALPTLIKGLEVNPKSIDLMIYTARYYKIIGDKSKALEYYDKAVYEAKNQGNQQVADTVGQEATELSQ